MAFKTYSSFANAYSSFANDYAGYTRGMGYSNPFSSSYGSLNLGDSRRTLIDMYKRKLEQQDGYSALPVDNSRSFLDRGLDALMLPLYTTAGMVKGMVDGGTKDNISPWEGALQGLRAGNPFGGGYDKGEYTYSRVLEAAGWHPDSLAGKIAKGTLGFVGDVLLDPTTYLSGGATALLKGTGRAGKAVEGFTGLQSLADKAVEARRASLLDQGVRPELVDRFVSKKADEWQNTLGEIPKNYTGEMTKPMAEFLVKNTSETRGIKLAPEEVARDAENLAKKYNSLRGIRDGSTGITFSLKHAPFGEKLFGALANKELQLGSGDTLRKIGDMTFAPGYAKLRDSIYGSKIGELFSTTSPLYRISKEDPAKLYDFLKFAEYTRGFHADKLASEKAIRDRAKTMGLSPSETTDVLTLMEDKTIWGKVSQTVKFTQTEQAKRIKEKITAQQAKTTQELQDLINSKNAADTLDHATASKMMDAKQEVETLRAETMQKLDNLDVKNVTDHEHLTKLIEMYDQELESLNKHLYESSVPAEQLTKSFDNYNSTLGDYKANAEHKFKLIDDLSHHIFGEGGHISQTVHDNTIQTLMKVINDGQPLPMIRDMIQKMPDVFTGKSSHMYSYVAQQIGYKDWATEYRKPMIALRNKMANGEELTLAEKRKLLELQRLNKQRTSLLMEFAGAKTIDDVMGVITKLENKKLGDIGDEMSGIYNSAQARKAKTQLDNQKESDLNQVFNDTAKKENFTTGGAPKSQYSETLPPSQRKKFGDGLTDNFDYSVKRTTSDVPTNKNFDAPQYDGGALNYHPALEEDMMRTLLHATPADALVRKDPNLLNKLYDHVMHEANLVMEKIFPGMKYEEMTAKQQEALHNIAYTNAINRAQGKEIITELGGKKGAKLIKDELDKRTKQLRIDQNVKTISHDTDVRFIQDGSALRGKVQNIHIKNGEVKYDILTKNGELVTGVKPEAIADVLRNGKSVTFEQMVAESPMLGDMVQRRRAVIEEATKARNELRKVDSVYTKQRESIITDFEARSAQLEEKVTKMEADSQAFKAAREAQDEAQIAELQRKVARMDAALNSDDALENYVRMTFGDARVDKIIRDAQPVDAGKIVLDNLPYSEEVKRITKVLRAEMLKLGKEEIDIGKLNEDAFAAWADEYLPRIATPDGARYFAQNKVVEKKKPSITRDLGFGTKFNPYSISRKIKSVKMPDGTWVENPTLQQINESLRPMLNGKNAFSENVADIYIARAMKHSELMYDHQYMETMLNTFGKAIGDLGEVEQGYKAVMNFGQLKKTVRDNASMHMSVQISEELSGALLSAMNLASRNAGRSVRLTDAQAQAVIKDFMDTHYGTPDKFSQLFESKIHEFIGGTGLPHKVFDDLATPMVELSPEQVRAIRDYHIYTTERYSALRDERLARGGGVVNEQIDKMNKMLDNVSEPQIRQVNDAIVMKANQARKLQMAKDESRALQLYDKFTHWIKLNMTTVMPSFHMRNKMANTFLNWLAIGSDSVDLKMQAIATKVAYHKGSIDKITERLDIRHADGTVTSMPWNEVYELAKQHKAIDEGFFAKDLGAEAMSNGVLKKVQAKFDPTDTANFIAYRKGAEFGSLIENSDRLIHFASMLKRGHTAEEAAASSKKFLFDYSDLTAFEQSHMKRILPFYTWLRKNGRLQVSQMLEQPGKYQMVGKVLGGVEGMNNEEDRINKGFLADFAKDWVQLPFSVTNAQGRKEPILWNPNLPFNDLARIPNPLAPIESLKNLFTQTNPLIKVPIEQALNKNVFFDRPIVDDGESQANRLDHIASQTAPYNAVKGFIQKSGIDAGLQVFNNVSGIKMLSYDYEAFKHQKIKEMLKNGASLDQRISDGISNTFSEVGKMLGGVISAGFHTAMSRAIDAIDANHPKRPQDYEDALRPISQARYEKLSDEEKQKYVPPTKDNAMAYNKTAVELSKQEYEQSGVIKQFAWALFDKLDLGKGHDFQLGMVEKVHDGDTFKVRIGDSSKEIRLLLVDTPETVDPRVKEPMPIGKESSDYSKNALFDKDVKVYFNGETDKYGRSLAYVEVDGHDYQQDLLQRGLAKTRYIKNPNWSRLNNYYDAEKQAYDAKKGIWSLDGYAKPHSDTGYYLDAVQRKLEKEKR